MEDMTDNLSPHKNELRGDTRATPVQVQCLNFRCLAFRDKEGRWLDYHNGKFLTGDVHIVDHNQE